MSSNLFLSMDLQPSFTTRCLRCCLSGVKSGSLQFRAGPSFLALHETSWGQHLEPWLQAFTAPRDWCLSHPQYTEPSRVNSISWLFHLFQPLPPKKGSKSSTLPKRAWHFYTQNSYFSVAPIGTHWLKPATLGSPTSVHQGLPAIPPACRGIRSIRSDQSKQLCRSCCRIRSSCHVMNQSVTAGYIWLYDIATLGLQLWVNEKHLLMNLYFINWFNLISLVRLIN